MAHGSRVLLVTTAVSVVLVVPDVTAAAPEVTPPPVPEQPAPPIDAAAAAQPPASASAPVQSQDASAFARVDQPAAPVEPAQPVDQPAQQQAVQQTAPPPVYAAPYPPQPAPAPAAPPMRSGRPMFWTGVGIFASSYLLTSAVGAGIIDSAGTETDGEDAVPRDPDQQRRYGQSLMVPIVGPFIAIRHTDSATAAWGSAFIGTVQAVGAALLVTGAVRWSRWNRYRRMNAYGVANMQGGSVGVRMRF